MTHTPAPEIHAPRFGLLLGSIDCHLCQAPTPTAALWVSSYLEVEEGESIAAGGPALLRYIEQLEPPTLAFVQSRTPWLRMSATRTSGLTYLAHHCITCGAVQGDHFVFDPDGPYWPQDDKALAKLKLVPGQGAVTAQATAGESAWMERVEEVCHRE